MTHPIPFPADLPAHSLDHWLSPELARVSPPNAPSRLRQLADAQGTLAAGWSSAIAGGPVLALTGAFFSAIGARPDVMETGSWQASQYEQAAHHPRPR
jgi:hypothetical protein